MPLHLEDIVIGFNEEGRPSGEADVEFANHADAVQAMRKNNALMGEIDSLSCVVTLFHVSQWPSGCAFSCE